MKDKQNPHPAGARMPSPSDAYHRLQHDANADRPFNAAVVNIVLLHSMADQ
jgi:hypothetical protein